MFPSTDEVLLTFLSNLFFNFDEVPLVFFRNLFFASICEARQGSGSPREKVVGGVREAGEKGAGRRRKGKITQRCPIFRN